MKSLVCLLFIYMVVEVLRLSKYSLIKFKLVFVIISLSFMSCNSQIEKVDPLKVVTLKKVEDQESLCLNTYKMEYFKTLRPI